MNILKFSNKNSGEIDARVVLDSIPDLVFLLDRHANIEWANQATAERLGMKREDLIDIDLISLIGEVDDGWDEESFIGKIHVRDLIQDGAASGISVHLRDHLGNLIPVVLSASLARFRKQNPIGGVICICKDITNFYALESSIQHPQQPNQ